MIGHKSSLSTITRKSSVYVLGRAFLVHAIKVNGYSQASYVHMLVKVNVLLSIIHLLLYFSVGHFDFHNQLCRSSVIFDIESLF